MIANVTLAEERNYIRGKSRRILGLMMVVALLLSACTGFLANNEYQFQGSVIEPALPASNFELIDQNGEKFVLSEQKGNVVLLFFGYTNCPDVCPITLANYVNIIKQIGETVDQARFVFITTDPERDTVGQIKNHLAKFDPMIIGLTGDLSTLESVWKDYSVSRDVSKQDNHGDVEIAHTSRIYVLDKSGNLRLTFPYGFSVDDMVQDIERLINE